MAKTSYKSLYEGAHFLNLLAQDLERISSQLDPSRVARFALRKVGEVLRADLAVQVDVNRADGMLQRPYLLALSPGARSWPNRRV